MGINKLFVALTSLTCLGLGIVQASLASALVLDRLSLYSPLRYRKVHRTFLHIARYAPSFSSTRSLTIVGSTSVADHSTHSNLLDEISEIARKQFLEVTITQI